MSNRFYEKLAATTDRNHSLLCVGLDPDPDLMPIDNIVDFNRAIIDATKDLVCAYKPNLAFYEVLGQEGHRALELTLEHIPVDIPVIGDAKRGDVQPTSKFLAKTMFELWNFDATTINPYGGRDAIQPFLDYTEKGIFFWCRSSNPSASEIQDIRVVDKKENLRLYQWISRHAAECNTGGNVGLVVGGTYPNELETIRKQCPDMPILIPGIGAQTGPLELAVTNGVDKNGRNAIINASRSVAYASNKASDFEKAAHNSADKIRRQIETQLNSMGNGWSTSTVKNKIA